MAVQLRHYVDPKRALVEIIAILDSRLLHGPRFAVVLDIDDTVISCRRELGEWVRVEHVFDFYKDLVSRNIKVFFVTARPHSKNNLQWTLEQLKSFGYNKIAGLFLMQLKPNTNKTKILISEFKFVIRSFIRETQDVTILVNVGNCWQDLLPSDAFRQMSFDQDLATYSFQGIGESVHICVKLPHVYDNS